MLGAAARDQGRLQGHLQRLEGAEGLAVPLAVIGLQAMSLPRYLQMFTAARDAGAEAQWWRVVGLSVGFAILVAGGAFVLGLGWRMWA